MKRSNRRPPSLISKVNVKYLLCGRGRKGGVVCDAYEVGFAYGFAVCDAQEAKNRCRRVGRALLLFLLRVSCAR